MIYEAEIFSKNLTEKKIPHSVAEDSAEKTTLKVDIMMGELSYNIWIIAEPEHVVTFRITDAFSAEDAKLDSALRLCNELNRENHWVKFFLEGNALVLEDPEKLSEGVDGEQIFALVGRNMQAIGGAFPRFKAL